MMLPKPAVALLLLSILPVARSGTLMGHVRDENWYAKYQSNPYGTGYYEYGVNANGTGLTSADGQSATDVFGNFSMPNLAAGSYNQSKWFFRLHE